MISNHTIKNCYDIFFKHVLLSRFAINDIYNIQYMKHWELPQRRTSNYRLMWIRQGSGHIHFPNTSIPLEKGRLILLAPNIEHYSTQGDETPVLYSINFKVEGIDNRNSPFYISYKPEHQSHYQSLFEALTKSFYKSATTLEKDIYHVTLQNILLNIYKDISMRECRTCSDDRITAAKDCLKRRVTNMPTLGELCELTGLSQAYFSRLFKEQVGVTPKHYMYQLKMEHSKYLLSQLNYSVKETAITLGYSDPYIFSNQFKRTYGYSPSVLSRGKTSNL